MKRQLANLLVCPMCQLALQLEVASEQDGEITRGSLQCSKCRRQYPILGSIPRFVTTDAYVSTFSFEWKRWRRTQFDTASRHTSLATFQKSTGREPADLARKVVLDAGCGAGRYMDLAAQASAQVVGVDLSLAVEVAHENLGGWSNCHFVQADLLHLPFPARTFDFIYSIGVLHHTPNPRESFARLVPALRPGGEIAICLSAPAAHGDFSLFSRPGQRSSGQRRKLYHTTQLARNGSKARPCPGLDHGNLQQRSARSNNASSASVALRVVSFGHPFVLRLSCSTLLSSAASDEDRHVPRCGMACA